MEVTATSARDAVARVTGGFTGAELANVVNEGVLLAARDDREVVTVDDLFSGAERTRNGVGVGQGAATVLSGLRKLMQGGDRGRCSRRCGTGRIAAAEVHRPAAAGSAAAAVGTIRTIEQHLRGEQAARRGDEHAADVVEADLSELRILNIYEAVHATPTVARGVRACSFVYLVLCFSLRRRRRD